MNFTIVAMFVFIIPRQKNIGKKDIFIYYTLCVDRVVYPRLRFFCMNFCTVDIMA